MQGRNQTFEAREAARAALSAKHGDIDTDELDVDARRLFDALSEEELEWLMADEPEDGEELNDTD